MKSQIIKGSKKIVSLLLILTILFGLVGCSGSDNYVANKVELTEDQEKLVTNPTVEYVITALSQIDTITGIELDPDPDDEYVAKVFFTSNLVDQSDFGEDESVYEKGTDAGGSIDIFKTVDEAVERDKYLHGFDDNILLNSGSHAVVGTLVIRTSHKLDEDKQNTLTESIISMLVSGTITEELIEQTMKEFSPEEKDDGKIKMPFSHEEISYKAYADVEKQFRDLGFLNIEFNVTEMNYEVKEEFDGSVLAVHIDGEWEFEKDDQFSPDTPIVISYVVDKRLPLPKSSSYCEELGYTEVVALFTSAGFTNVKAVPTEVEYTESVADGSVVIVSVGDNPIFEEGARYSADTEILVHYRAIQPKPVETPPPVSTEQPTESSKPTVETEEPSGNNEVMVWIPTNGGTKYHSRSGCSNMKNPQQVTLDEAQSRGFTACKRCH